ncbi:MAG TPA: hypothetical protein VJX48_03240 [Xanthobacteraceae bacterium]|nr:hypothetical protein [Xanthobacteraceae bacterium]
MESLSLDLKRWWNLIAAAGALLAVASVAVQFVPGVLMGLGLLFFGAGEWGNHAIHVKRSSDTVVESYPWYPYPFGLLLDAIGIGLFGFGLYRLEAFGP